MIQQVRQGDLDAYGELIRLTQASVFNVCYRILGNRQEAEDLVQEAFIRAFQQFSRFDPERPFGPWMRTVAANLCYNHLKKVRVKQVPLEDERDRALSNPGRSPEQMMEISQENQRLYRTLWELTPNQRLALELRHFQGLSYQEMARNLNLPINTVRSHLYRGRRKLAQLLEGEDHEK